MDERGITPVIPNRCNRKQPFSFSKRLYKLREQSARKQATEMGEPRAERRLAAMFAGDGAGYSRLMGTDEESTRARLNAHRCASSWNQKSPNIAAASYPKRPCPFNVGDHTATSNNCMLRRSWKAELSGTATKCRKGGGNVELCECCCIGGLHHSRSFAASSRATNDP